MHSTVRQVRLWNIPEQRVVDDVVVHDMVSAAAFTADGGRAVVGTLKGKCRFYQVAGGRLEYAAQIGAHSASACDLDSSAHCRPGPA